MKSITSYNCTRDLVRSSRAPALSRYFRNSSFLASWDIFVVIVKFQLSLKTVCNLKDMYFEDKMHIAGLIIKLIYKFIFGSDFIISL